MQPLLQILQSKLIPRAKAGAAERIIVARKRMSRSGIPAGVGLAYRKMPGKRVIVKGGRIYGNTRLIRARWPEAGMHETENHRLVCVIEGRGHFYVGNYQLECTEGDFILIPHGMPHPANQHPGHLIASTAPGRFFVLLWMSPYRRGFQCWLSRYDEQGIRYNQAVENYLFLSGQVIELFQMLVNEACDTGDESLCDGLLLALCSALRRETVAEHFLRPGPIVTPGAPPEKGDDFTAQLRNYIEGHLNQPLTSAQVARELYMSRTQFVRRMRQETGQSFVEFLTAYRIEEAQRLLRESEWTAQAISKFVGFKSPAYFHTLFQRQVGCTPGEFRLKSH